MKVKSRQYLSSIISFLPSGKPIIFWDTCSILELLRISERSVNPEDDFNHYLFIADKIASGEVLSVTSMLVWQEFNQNYNDKLMKLKRLEQNRVSDVKKVTAVMKPGKKRVRIEDSLNDLHTETRITSTISKIWRNTILIREQTSFLKFAYLRVKYKMAPSRNKQQFKDCYIWGSFLAFAHSVSTCPMILFYSLNTSDFYDPNTHALDSQIVLDLSSLPNTEFCNILGVLYSKIKTLCP